MNTQDRNAIIQRIKEICKSPSEYEDKDISKELKWPVKYQLGNTIFFEAMNGYIDEIHIINFPKIPVPGIMQDQWVYLQHEYSHCLLGEKFNGFGYCEFDGNVNPNFNDQILLNVIDHTFNQVVDWFVDYEVNKRFPNPFKSSAKRLFTDCIKSYGDKVEGNFVLYYAFALAQMDYYVINLNIKLPPKSNLTNSIKKVFLSNNPRKQSNENIRDMVNRIFLLMKNNSIINKSIEVDLISKKVGSEEKNKEMEVLDIKVFDM